ncbi:YetF domain-containing protein [Mesorhizobium sp. SP-1A]|uniref:YetF domain-containing protein n=1 Tax=Mesorhizobium sp. SP-1A TaxID=3077840 RepID=UPI0028F70816|nr:YetF domain-containing protein [Mesorhizobium sp. SP-1A]
MAAEQSVQSQQRREQLIDDDLGHQPGAKFVEGSTIVLVKNGRIVHEARKRAMISESGLREALRQDGNAGMGEVKIMKLQLSGEISIVKRYD